jgi:cytochrome c biogenesis protein CcmG/thiol:disulfide interchange protein DsbE
MVATVLLVLTACAQIPAGGTEVADFESITGPQLEEVLAVIGRPVVVNVWASWCHPCRSEAPLLAAAHSQFDGEIEFIGVDVQDNQSDAKSFVSQFGLEFTHYFDRDRSVPNHFGVIGTPVTMFFDAEGNLVSTHLGVIDERSLALGIDEIRRH